MVHVDLHGRALAGISLIAAPAVAGLAGGLVNSAGGRSRRANHVLRGLWRWHAGLPVVGCGPVQLDNQLSLAQPWLAVRAVLWAMTATVILWGSTLLALFIRLDLAVFRLPGRSRGPGGRLLPISTVRLLKSLLITTTSYRFSLGLKCWLSSNCTEADLFFKDKRRDGFRK